MKPIVQKHSMGCGIACVASIAGISYANALRRVNSKLASTKGYYCRDLVNVLAKLELKYEFGKIGPKTKKYLGKEGTIVFIARSKRHPAGHYLTYTKNGWMNPWINYPCIAPVKAGFQKRLPGKALWVIFKVAP